MDLATPPIRIGTRGSVLALAQANWVKRRIELRCPEAIVEIRVIRTGGDRFSEAPMQILRGKGVFTKEIEDALLAYEIDVAVHSMKDLPPELPRGLVIAAISEREDPSDVLVSNGSLRLRDLSAGARIGTASLRRKAQVLHYRRDFRVLPIRGNIDTRLSRTARGARFIVMKSPGRVQTRFNWVKTWRSVCCNKGRVEFSATLLRRQRRETIRRESKSEQSHKAMSGALDRRSNADNRKSRKLLFGKRIVITRARSQAGELARRIEELEGEVIYCPAIEIESPESCDALDRAIAVIQTYDWLIFTSVNGVERFLMRLQRLSGSLSKLTGTQIAAIGPQTAARLAREGLKPAVVPKRYLAEGILHVLTPDMMRGKRVLIPRAAKARDILPETLRAWGATVDVVDAYRTVVPETDVSVLRTLLHEQNVDMITFTSSSTVVNFVRLFGVENLGELLGSTATGCIGPITQGTLEELGGRATVVAEEFTIDGLVRAITRYFEAQARVE